MKSSAGSQYHMVAAVLLLGVMVGCKPKPQTDAEPTSTSAAPAIQATVNQTATPQQGKAVSADGTLNASSQASRIQHAHTDHPHGDINAVADKLDPATKEDLERLIEQRAQAPVQVQTLPGGGQSVQLNGARDSIAVAVVNDDGDVQVYHHGEALKSSSHNPTTTPQTAVTAPQTSETVKPYPPVKKVHAPTARD